MGGYLLIFTMDHKHIQPIQGHPFLNFYTLSVAVKMVALRNSVSYFNGASFRKPNK